MSVRPLVPPAHVRPRAPLAAVGAILVLLGSCGERSYQDGWEPPPGRDHALFLASGPLQPSSEVMVLAQVPPLRYSGGVIEITGGSELMVVPPEAWREYTGTALSLEEAERELARARRLEASLHTLGVSADAVMELLRRRLETRAEEPLAPVAAPMPGAPSARPAPSGTHARVRGAPGREQELVAISDRALDQLQEVLVASAQDAAAAQASAQERTAVADADALEAADDRSCAQAVAMTVARSRGEADAAAREQAYRTRQQAWTTQRERSDAQRRDDLARRQAEAQASVRQRIASIHQRTAHELLQCCADDQSGCQTLAAGAGESHGAAMGRPGDPAMAGAVDGHGH